MREAKAMTEQITLDKFTKNKELVWECQDCGLRTILQNGKRHREYPQLDVSKYSDSFAMLLEERRLLNAKVRNCRHEHKIYGENYCRICGKRLTNPKSVDREIGPVCFKHSQKARADMMIAKEIRKHEVALSVKAKASG